MSDANDSSSSDTHWMGTARYPGAESETVPVPGHEQPGQQGPYPPYGQYGPYGYQPSPYARPTQYGEYGEYGETSQYGPPNQYGPEHYGAEQYGAHPYGGHPGWGGWQPPHGTWPGPGPAPRRRRPVAAVLVGIAIVLVMAMVAGGIVVRGLWPALTGSTSDTGPQAGAGSNGSGNGSGFGNGNGFGNGSGDQGGFGGAPGGGVPGGGAPSTGANGPLSGVAAAVAPSIVDVNTVLGMQGARAAGTGIVLTSTGEILTNNHVVQGATSISVTDVGNGQTYQANVVGYDRSEDIAVIQLQGASGLRTASIGDSTKVASGDQVIALGNAGGVGGTPSAAPGTVSGVDQAITASDENGSNAEHLTGLIQVAADIQAGDSGGPLIDSAGHVIGMDTAASSGFRFQASGGEGFAIPINQAVAVAKEIKAGHASGTIHIGATGFLGVDLTDAGGSGGGAGAGGTGGGAAVAGVVDGSPAAQAGLVRGEVIVSIDGQSVDQPSAVTSLLDKHHPGDKVKVGVADQTGSTQTVTVTLGTGPVG